MAWLHVVNLTYNSTHSTLGRPMPTLSLKLNLTLTLLTLTVTVKWWNSPLFDQYVHNTIPTTQSSRSYSTPGTILHVLGITDFPTSSAFCLYVGFLTCIPRPVTNV